MIQLEIKWNAPQFFRLLRVLRRERRRLRLLLRDVRPNTDGRGGGAGAEPAGVAGRNIGVGAAPKGAACGRTLGRG